MPQYFYQCTQCAKVVRKIFSVRESQEPQSCPDCKAELKRTPKPPTSQVVERLDNGWMPKALERPAEAERLYKERAQKDPLKDD